MLKCISYDGSERNACDIGFCTQSILRIIGAESASFSQVLLVKPSDSTRVDEKELPPKTDLAIKIFRMRDGSDKLLENEDLLYELAIYKDVVSFILNNSLNPYFLPYYGGCKKMSGGQVLDILDGRVTDIRNRYLSRAYLENVLARKLGDNKFDFNSALEKQPKKIKSYTFHPKDEFAIIITEKAPSTISDFLLASRTTLSDLRCCLVQVTSALLVLKFLGLAHNDLHYGNIFYRRTPTPLERKFIFRIYSSNRENSILVGYTLTTTLVSLLFDWNDSYIQEKGENPELAAPDPEKVYEKASMQNRYVEKRDFVKFLMYYRKAPGIQNSQAERTKLVECIFPDASSENALKMQRYLKNVENKNYQYLSENEKDIKARFPDSFYQEMYPLEGILYRLVFTFAGKKETGPISPLYRASQMDLESGFVYNMDDQYIATLPKNFTE